MKTDKPWLLLLAVALGAAIGAVVASKSRRLHQRAVRDLEHTTDVKAWENEGGNLAPTAATAVLP
jgi:hypothetical protein